jgi:hypothetical protein
MPIYDFWIAVPTATVYFVVTLLGGFSLLRVVPDELDKGVDAVQTYLLRLVDQEEFLRFFVPLTEVNSFDIGGFLDPVLAHPTNS